MARLTMADGSTREVGYAQAADIKAVLDGHKEPENPTQAAFCLQVVDITFDTIARPVGPRVRRTEPDQKLRDAAESLTVTGYAKFRAVGKRLRELAG